MFPHAYFAKGYWPGTYFPPTGEAPPEGSMWATLAGTSGLEGALVATGSLEGVLVGEGSISGTLGAAEDGFIWASLGGTSTLAGTLSFTSAISPTGGGEFLSERIIRARIAARVGGTSHLSGTLSFVFGDTDEDAWILLD
jgi:hypothetical protein